MDQTLLNHFLELLETSSSYQLLKPEQQEAIKASYNNVSDEQLEKAIEALKENEKEVDTLKAEQANREEHTEKKVILIQSRIREVKRDHRKEAEAADSASEKQEIQSLLQEIKSVNTPKEDPVPKKRKKFLGIF